MIEAESPGYGKETNPFSAGEAPGFGALFSRGVVCSCQTEKQKEEIL